MVPHVQRITAHGGLPLISFRDRSPIQFPALTGVRFPLALWVIVHHLTGPGQMLDDAVGSLPQPGRVLVDMAHVALGTFFMLSGFVLAHGYGRMRWDRAGLRRYLVARFARVYPVYLLSLLIIAPIAVRQLDAGGVGVAAAYVLLLQAWAAMPVDWNAPAWSLSCELFFYLCFPVAVVLFSGSRRRTLLLAALALALPVAVRAAGLPKAWKPPLYLGDFLMGMALAAIYEHLVKRRSRLAGRGYWLYAPGAALGLAAILGSRAIQPWDFTDTLLRLANAGLVLGLALGGGYAVRALSTPAALLAGKATYAMYILHIPLLWWYRRWVLDALIPYPAAPLVYIAAVVVLSAAVFLLYEEPANRRIRRALSDPLSRC